MSSVVMISLVRLSVLFTFFDEIFPDRIILYWSKLIVCLFVLKVLNTDAFKKFDLFCEKKNLL